MKWWSQRTHNRSQSQPLGIQLKCTKNVPSDAICIRIHVPLGEMYNVSYV